MFISTLNGFNKPLKTLSSIHPNRKTIKRATWIPKIKYVKTTLLQLYHIFETLLFLAHSRLIFNWLPFPLIHLFLCFALWLINKVKAKVFFFKKKKNHTYIKKRRWKEKKLMKNWSANTQTYDTSVKQHKEEIKWYEKNIRYYRIHSMLFFLAERNTIWKKKIATDVFLVMISFFLAFFSSW